MVVTMVVPGPVHRVGRVGVNVAVKRGLMSTFIWTNADVPEFRTRKKRETGPMSAPSSCVQSGDYDPDFVGCPWQSGLRRYDR
jgi:hypothetical protein